MSNVTMAGVTIMILILLLITILMSYVLYCDPGPGLVTAPGAPQLRSPSVLTESQLDLKSQSPQTFQVFNIVFVDC